MLSTMAAVIYVAYRCIHGYEQIKSDESKKLGFWAAQALKRFWRQIIKNGAYILLSFRFRKLTSIDSRMEVDRVFFLYGLL